MITELLLEVKPPKVPLKKLIEKGYIKENQELYDKDANNNGWDFFYVTNDGKLVLLDNLRYQYDKEINND